MYEFKSQLLADAECVSPCHFRVYIRDNKLYISCVDLYHGAGEFKDFERIFSLTGKLPSGILKEVFDEV